MPRDEAAVLPAEPGEDEKKVRAALLEKIAVWHDEQAHSHRQTADLAWDEIIGNTVSSIAAKRAFERANVARGVHEASAKHFRDIALEDRCNRT